MTSRRALTLSLLLSTCLFAQPLAAQETYLLQLGSFESREEAQKRWETLKNKYPELLSGLSLQVKDVSLPPDNFTVFRTQAGPLTSNANALTVCDRLTARGDECYVVETAMFAPDAAPGSIPNPPLMVADDAIRQSVKKSDTPKPEEPVAEAQPQAEETKSEGALATDDVTMPPVPAQQASEQPAEEKPAEPVAEKAEAPAVARIAVPATKAEALAEATPVAETAETQQSLPEAAPAEPAPAETAQAEVAEPQPEHIEQAFEQSTPEETPVASPAPLETATPDVPLTEEAAEESGSFWSFLAPLNPFTWGDEAEEEEVAQDESELSEPQLAEDQAFDVASEETNAAAAEALTQETAPPAALMAEPQALPPSDSSLAAPPSEPMPWHQTEASQLQSGYLSDSRYAEPQSLAPAAGSLPTPPQPPEDGEFRAATQQRLDVAMQSGSVGMSHRTAARAPLSSGQVPFAIREGSTWKPEQQAAPVPAAPEVQADGRADVTVAEAVRVPLSEQNAPLGVPPAALGSPSQQLPGARSLWAQIGYFADDQAAMGYWSNYQSQHPELPPVRIRVVSPYKIESTESRVSLRVGPFNEGYQVENLCKQIETQDVHCRPMAELGTSASLHGGGALPARYGKRPQAANQNQADMYWVQLGTFGSEGEAKAHWDMLNEKNKDIMAGFESAISAPPATSGAEGHRLRSGPFPLRHKADALCTTLKMRGENCVVIFGK